MTWELGANGECNCLPRLFEITYMDIDGCEQELVWDGNLPTAEIMVSFQEYEGSPSHAFVKVYNNKNRAIIKVTDYLTITEASEEAKEEPA